MAQEVERWAFAEEPDREAVAKALAIAIAALDLTADKPQAEADRKAMANLLTRLADDHELGSYGQYARSVIIEIAGRGTVRR